MPTPRPITITISSTFADLKEHRAILLDTIDKFGFLAQAVEFTGTLPDAEVIEASLRMVRASDVYIGLIGSRYGQILRDPKQNPQWLSLTELELNEATKLGQPRLLFISDQNRQDEELYAERYRRDSGKLDGLRARVQRAGPVYVFESIADFAAIVPLALGELAKSLNLGERKSEPKKGLRADFLLSYHSTDESAARAVERVLSGAGYSVSARFKDLPARSDSGADEKLAGHAERTVVLLSPAYESSTSCLAEWQARTPTSLKKLVPLLIEPTALEFLPRWMPYVNLVGLSGEAFAQRVLEAVETQSAGSRPVPDLISPVRHGWSSKDTLTVEHSALAQPELGGGPGDLLKQIAAARNLARKLAAQSGAPDFNHSRQYALQFAAYLEELPTSQADGNIYLCDAAARTLREMFASEAQILSVAFSAPLKTFLECHLGLRAYYPELAAFYVSVRGGALVAPLPMDAVTRVADIVRAHTPDTFDASVGETLEKEKASSPSVTEGPHEAQASTDPTPQPPPDPITTATRAQTRDQLIARTINDMWAVFLKGKDIVANIEGWRRAYETLEPVVRPILAYLRGKTGL